MTPKQRRRIEFKQRNLVQEIGALEKVIGIMKSDDIKPHETSHQLRVLKRLNRWYEFVLTTSTQPTLLDVPFAQQDR